MVESLDFCHLRLPSLSYYIEKNKLYFNSIDGSKGFIEIDFLNTIDVTPTGVIKEKATGFINCYKYDGDEFLTLTQVVLRLANNLGLDIHFGADALEDVAALTPPFQEIPFRTYKLFPKNSKAVIAFNPESQLNILRTFNRHKCLLALELNKKYPLKPLVLSKLRARLSAFNTANAAQVGLF